MLNAFFYKYKKQMTHLFPSVHLSYHGCFLFTLFLILFITCSLYFSFTLFLILFISSRYAEWIQIVLQITYAQIRYLGQSMDGR